MLPSTHYIFFLVPLHRLVPYVLPFLKKPKVSIKALPSNMPMPIRTACRPPQPRTSSKTTPYKVGRPRICRVRALCGTPIIVNLHLRFDSPLSPICKHSLLCCPRYSSPPLYCVPLPYVFRLIPAIVHPMLSTILYPSESHSGYPLQFHCFLFISSPQTHWISSLYLPSFSIVFTSYRPPPAQLHTSDTPRRSEQCRLFCLFSSNAH